MNKLVVSVFGSAMPPQDSLDYQVAYQLGKLLAENQFTVSSGGYTGIMAGVSQGAAEADGHVIGVTCAVIERHTRRGANEWVKQVVHYETLHERMLHLVFNNSGMIILPGGIGTLAELAAAWDLMRVRSFTKRPLIAVGEYWKTILWDMSHSQYVDRYTRNLFHFVDTPEEAVLLLKEEIGQ